MSQWVLISKGRKLKAKNGKQKRRERALEEGRNGGKFKRTMGSRRGVRESVRGRQKRWKI